VLKRMSVCVHVYVKASVCYREREGVCMCV